MENKEFFYIGHYYTADGKFVLKPGTTNNLARRKKEHDSAYLATPNFPRAFDSKFEYDFFIPLSKYNTLRIEDRTKEKLKEIYPNTYCRNDRFIFNEKPKAVTVTVRKTYTIYL